MIALIMGLIYGLGGYTQNHENIIWGDRVIDWKDFKGQADSKSPYKAITYTEFGQFLDFDKDTLTIRITAEFVPTKSWVKEEKSDYLLKHEQIHFDIVEYVARLYRKAVLDHHFESYDEIIPTITGLFKHFSQKRKKLQDDYDLDTDHSRFKPIQNKWNREIEELLIANKDYAATTYKIYIGYLKE